MTQGPVSASLAGKNLGSFGKIGCGDHRDHAPCGPYWGTRETAAHVPGPGLAVRHHMTCSTFPSMHDLQVIGNGAVRVGALDRVRGTA